MFIEEIGRHLSVSSVSELEASMEMDKEFWNVVSIRGLNMPRPTFLRFARQFHEVLCEDVDGVDATVPSRPLRTEDVVGIFNFVDAHPGEPVLVHCLMGISRSPGVALALILRGMIANGWNAEETTPLVARAVDLLLQIRRKARPNALFLRLCLEQFLPQKQTDALMAELAVHPILGNSKLAKPGKIRAIRGPYRLGN